MIRYHARWVYPVSTPPIANGTVVEAHDRIEFVGPRALAPPGGEDVELGDAILLPGLVNAHCHLELTAMRGFLDGLGFRDWILRLTAARAAVLTYGMMLDAARLGVDEGLRHGVTTFADTGDSGAGFQAMLERGVRGICYREVFGPDPAQSAASIADLTIKLDEMSMRATPLVRVGVSPHAPYTVSDALYRATAALAKHRSLPLATHVAESAIETDLIVNGAGPFADGLRARAIPVTARARSPIALLEQREVLDCRPLLIHCIRVDTRDVDTIARTGSTVAHCPASNAKLGHGIAPLAALLDADIAVGIGTDSVASNDRMELLEEARLAALLSAAREQRVDVVSAARALRLATLGGAHALGIQDDVGSLERGKFADMVAFPLPAHRAPMHEPAAALVYAMAGTPASLVTVAGRVLVRDGSLTTDDPALAGRVQATADLLQAWLVTQAARNP